jgi:hypothetical protein
MALQPELVGIADQQFFIANVMKDCPAKTVIRELLQNAIENSAESGGKIEWFKELWNGTPKLGLYNEGPAMTHDDLFNKMQIASTSKILSFTANFGQGAKMSAGKASPYGLLYRSCKDGKVYEVWLQVIDLPDGTQQLVMRPQYDEYDEEEVIVKQVTDEAFNRGRDLNLEWTEAILLGRSAEDDTLNGHFLGEKDVPWLIRLIAERYYEFPTGIEVHNGSVTAEKRKPEERYCSSLSEILSRPTYTSKQETVSINHPFFGHISLVYGRMTGSPKERKGGGWVIAGISGGSHVCLVYKGEIYDYKKTWVYQQGAYGFSGISEDYYVHILISPTAPVRNNNHRTVIETADKEAIPLTCLHFADLVRAHRPQWVLDDIRERFNPDMTGSLHERLRKAAKQYMAYVSQPVVAKEGFDFGNIELGYNNEHGGIPAPPTPGPKPPRPPEPQLDGPILRPRRGKKTERPRPDTINVEFRPEESVEWYEGMQGRAAAYDVHANTLWLSSQFDGYQRLKAWVDQEWIEEEDNRAAQKCLNEEYCYHAGLYAIGALTFRGVVTWRPEEWQKGLTPEAFSCLMLDVKQEIPKAIKAKMGRHTNRGLRNRQEEALNA